MHLAVGAEVPIPPALRRTQSPAKTGSISRSSLLPLVPRTLPDVVQTLAESSSSHVANTFLETSRGEHWCIFTAPCCLHSQGHVLVPALDLSEMLIKVSLSHLNSLPYQGCSLLETCTPRDQSNFVLSHNLQWDITAESFYSEHHHKFFSCWNTYLHLLFSLGCFKDASWSTIAIPWSTCFNVLRVCQISQDYKVPKFLMLWSAPQKKQKRCFWRAACKAASQQAGLSHTTSPYNEHPDNSGVRQAMCV